MEPSKGFEMFENVKSIFDRMNNNVEAGEHCSIAVGHLDWTYIQNSHGADFFRE